MLQIAAGALHRYLEHFFANLHYKITGIAMFIDYLRPKAFIFEKLEMNLLIDWLKLLITDPFFGKILIHYAVELPFAEIGVTVADRTQDTFEDLAVSRYMMQCFTRRII